MIGQILELRRVLRNQRLTPVELEALRERKLRAVIRNAYQHVPYYRSLFDSAGLAPEEIRTVDDLTKIPLTTKDDLRAAGVEKTVADWADLSTCVRTMTSGSSGKPFAVFRTPSEFLTTRMLITAALLKYGFGWSDRLISLEGDQMTLVPFHKRLRFLNRELIASGPPGDELIQEMVKARPTMIWAMPATLRAILHNTTVPLRDLMPLKAVVTWGQAVDALLQTRLQNDLCSVLFNTYGANEGVLIAWECPSRNGLHINAAHFVIECLPDETIGEGEEVGFTVVTSLDSLAMPFIRYRIGDLCSLSSRKCSCGSPLPLMDRLFGREWEVIWLPSGKAVHPHRLDHLLRAFPGVFQWQVVQETLGHFLVRLVMDGPIEDGLVSRIQSQILEYVREPVTVEIAFVDHIDDGSPKSQAFISKVPRPGSQPS